MDDDQENHKKLPLIKIKIQKYVQEEKVDPIIGSRSNDGPRVCNVCNKGFGSGKALGGHMRVHAQAHKERSPNNDHSNGEESDRTSCSICRKKFPSMKSLFGHMRCHPEREWRGIQPPAPATTASSTSISGPSDDLNGTIDLAKSLPSWPSTDRRGRQALICCHDSSTLSEVEEEERIREAVHDLMRLARGESLHQVEATNSNSPTNRAEIGEYFSVKKPKIDERGRDNLSGGTGRVVIVKNLDRGKGKTDDGEEEGPNVNYNLGEKVKIMIKKKRKKMKLINLDSVSTPPERYKCSTCNKCFSTHQALGGHRSSHNKIKNDEDEHNANNVPTLVDEVASKEIIEGGGISSYKCKICNKSFSTGQALGGHKRSHWSGPVEDPASQSETGRRILGFDLNEVPRMDDEEVGGCGYHDPSSSYNSTS